MQEMRDLYLLRALKEGGHKWSPSVKRDRRGTTPEGNSFVASRAAREETPPCCRMSTAVLIELGDGSARSIGTEPTCSDGAEDARTRGREFLTGRRGPNGCFACARRDDRGYFIAASCASAT